MCIKSYVAFTGPFKDMDICSICNASQYEEDKLAQSNGQIEQLQALKYSPEIALALQYLFDHTHILEKMEASNEIIEEYNNICQDEDILHSFYNGNIEEHDFVLMLSVDGAQLYQSK